MAIVISAINASRLLVGGQTAKLQISARIVAVTTDGVNEMMLKTLIKHLKDMEMLYGDAVVYIKDDKQKYRITSVEGFMGEKRKNECRDPNIVIINVRQTG